MSTFAARSPWVAACVLGAALAAVPAADAIAQVTIKDLGPALSGAVAQAQSIAPLGLGPAGEVVGIYRAEVLAPTQALVTGPDGTGLLAITSAGFDAVAHDINAAGQVTGTSSGRAFIYDPAAGTLRFLEPPQGSSGIGGFAINAAGQVTGAASFGGTIHAFLSGPGGGPSIDLGSFGNEAFGADLNDRGQVVGSAILADGSTRHAFVATADGGMHDVGTLGGRFSFAYSVNNAGAFVGMSHNQDQQLRAFIGDVDGGPLRDLGTLGGSFSRAAAINDAGEVVGLADDATGARHVFLWREGSMIDVGTLEGVSGSGWTLEEAVDINDKGQILGYGSFNGQRRVFLLTPGVPEPATWLLTFLGLGAASAVARRRAKR